MNYYYHLLPNMTHFNQKSRKNVHSIRLMYDAARARLKSARPEKVESLRTEMEASEDEFVGAVEDAMSKMKSVVENPMALKLLTAFVNAQLAYHKECYETLLNLSPEMEELKVTQDALMGSR